MGYKIFFNSLKNIFIIKPILQTEGASTVMRTVVISLLTLPAVKLQDPYQHEQNEGKKLFILN